jgi:hypothetical protein
MFIDLIFVAFQTLIGGLITGALGLPFDLIGQFLQELFFPTAVS